MAETPQQIVDRELREFKRYTGDGLPGEPVNAPLPVGDPQSGNHNPKKVNLRKALKAPLEGWTEQADRAEAEADHSEEWAQSDDPISEAAGGDGATDRSSKWHADRSETAQGLSEDAQAASEAARDTALGYSNDALSSKTQAELAALAAGAPLFTSEPDLGTAPSPYLLQVEAGTQVWEHDGTDATMVGWLGKVEFPTVAALKAFTGPLGPVGTEIEAQGRRWRVVAPDTPGRYTTTSGGVRLDRTISEEAGFSPLRNPQLEALVSSVVVIASRLRDGFVYGVASGVLQRSSDGGRTWTAMMSIGSVSLLIPAGDGEVLAACTGAGVRKSSGWAANPLTATWTTVLSSADSDFLSWGLDSDGQGLAVAAHYRSADYTKSRYVWKSTDSGVTWSTIFDLDDYNSGDANPGQHHLHFCALDPWANNRIWISWHENTGAGGGGGKAIMYSDDLGDTWNVLTTEWQPTTAVATPFGMVFGTDDGPGGILHCERTDDPADMRIYLAAPFPVEQTAFAWVFAVYAEYDEREGVAYTSFVSQVDGTPAGVFASDGRNASELYRSLPQNNGDGFREFAFHGDQIVWRTRIKDSGGTPTNYTMRTGKARRGPSNPSEFDTGRIMGGRIVEDPAVTPFRSTAVGVLAEAGPSPDAVAIGYKARAGYSSAGNPQAIAIGSQAEAPNTSSLAIGFQAKAPLASVAIGGQAEATTADVTIGRQSTALGNAVAVGWQALARSGAVAIGRSAVNKSSGSVDYVAIGREATADSNGVAIGRDADAGIRGFALGRSATSVQDAFAFGYQATAGHNNSVTFGQATTQNNQFRIGDNRNIMLSERTQTPATPATGEAAIYLFNNDGTWEIRVRFSNGTQKTLADWT